MNYAANMDKAWPGFLMRSFSVRRKMALLAVPAALAGAWFVYPALTPNFKENTLGIKPTIEDPAALVRMQMRAMQDSDKVMSRVDEEDA